MIRQSCLTALALVLPAALTPAMAQSPAPKNECFFVSQFESWKAGADAQTMYIRVSGRRFYRLDMGNRCNEMSWPGATLVNHFHGSAICSPLDWDMQVSQGVGGMVAPCIVKKMTRLSDAEVTALPAKQKP
jgi:hypothetical protein